MAAPVITKPQQPRPRRVHRVLGIVLAVVLVIGIVLPYAVKPQAAQAFPGEAMAAAVWTFVKNKIQTGITIARKGALDLAYKNALRTALTQFAQDTALRITTSGPGQGPIFPSDPKYYLKYGSAAAGDFLDTLGTKAFGVDVCKPLNLHTQFSIESAVNFLVGKALSGIDPAQQCERDYNKALTQDLMVVGAAVFPGTGSPDGTSDTSGGLRMVLPDAKKQQSQIQSEMNSIEGCKANAFDTVKCGASHDFTLCPYTDLLDINGKDVHSLGECLQQYTKDITTYQKTADQVHSQCVAGVSQPRQQRCTAAAIFDNYSNTYSKLGQKNYLIQLTKYYEPGESDIGSLITLNDKVQQKADQAQQEERDVQSFGIGPIRDPVTGKVVTTGDLTKATAQTAFTQDPSNQVNKVHTDSPLADARDVFLSTLIKNKLSLTKKLMDLLFKKGPAGGSTLSNIKIINGQVQTSSGLQAAQAVISSLLTPDFNTGGTGAVLEDLVSCPESDPGPNNCVINEGFNQAISQGLTIKEALDQKLLDGSKPFGFSSVGTATNDTQEPDFRQGYPYRSMLILRRLRIIPVGWELAAQYIRDFGGCGSSQAGKRTICTLQQVVDAYDQCDTTTNSWSPFCGLVDPEWVLKAPETLCAVSGATAALTSNDYLPDPVYPDAPQVSQIGRVASCVDEKTCLQEDDQGHCLSYGYCVQERQSWRFGGDQCTNYYHSCDSFTLATGTDTTDTAATLATNANGAPVNYLGNSLDYSSCTAANAGCSWYCRDVSSTNTFTCTDTTGNKDYLTASAQTCPAEDAGCQEFIRTVNGTNLLGNGSFETRKEGDALDDGIPDDFSALGWSSNAMTVEAVSDANTGSTAARLTGPSDAQLTSTFSGGYPLNGLSLTLSFYAKAVSGSCTGNTAGVQTNTTTQLVDQPQAFDTTDSWQRYVQTVTFDPTLSYTDNQVKVYFTGNSDSCSIILDDVQLESGATYSPYHDYGSENKIYLNGNRVSCTADEAGCDLYTSTTDQIPGVATTADICPADQVGCKAFLEVPVTGNGAKATFPDRTGKRCSADQSKSCSSNSDCSGIGTCLASVSLIPSTGTTCSAASAGCEEYTNLDVVSQGGEGKEYYTYIRPCAKPGDDAAHEKTYYTWIGSDQTGFQLQAYIFQSSDTAYIDADDSATGGPAYIDGINDTALTPTALCNASIFANINDPLWSPDCRQFYDAALNTYYRLYSRTVSISNDCHPLRNTLDTVIYNAIPSEGTTCPASENLCREYRGPTGYNTRDLINDNFDDNDTLGWDVGVPSSQSLSFGGYSMSVQSSVQTTADVDIPHQLQQDRSYVLTFWASSSVFCDGSSQNPCPTITASFAGDVDAFAGTATARWTGSDQATGIPEWNSYTLGPLNLQRPPDLTTEDGDPADDLRISGTAPFYIDNIRLQEVSDSQYLIKNTPLLCAGFEGCDKYSNRAGDTSYLKSFTRLCQQEKVGCEALINTQNSDSPFSQNFSNGTNVDGTDGKDVPADQVQYYINDPVNYCHEENQGCTALGKPTLGSAGSACVNDPTKPCSTTNALDTCGTSGLCNIPSGSTSGTCRNISSSSCTSDADCGADNADFDASQLCQSHDVSITQYEQQYAVEDPDQYSTALCKVAEVGCNAYTNARTAQTVYFRDPGPYTCEYKSVQINGQSVTGWYKSGTTGLNPSDVCPGVTNAGPSAVSDIDIVPVNPYSQPTSGVCQYSQSSTCSEDSDCTNLGGGSCIHFAGMCPADQAGCTEYRDQSDPSGCYSQCVQTIDQVYGENVPVDSTCKKVVQGTCSTNADVPCFRDQECVDANAGSCQKTTGCRAYYYLAQTVEDNSAECNGIANDELGCRSFYSPDASINTTPQ